MSATTGPSTSGLAVRTYRLLLRAYPATFRAAYGGEMERLFRDQLRDHRRGTPACGRPGQRFWPAVLWDVVRSAPALRLDALREAWHGSPHLQPDEDTMKAKRAVAVAVLLGGVFEVINAGIEWRAGSGLGRDAGWVAALALGTLSGTLLAVAGGALLRGGPSATRAARVAALACLALSIGVQLVFPYMSTFSRLIEVCLPIALLFVTRGPRGDVLRQVAH